MTTFTELRRPLEFLTWEVYEQYSREGGTLAASQGDLLPGTVVAKVTSNGQFVIYDNTSATAGVATAYGILTHGAPNSASTQKVTIVERFALVKAPLVVWGTNDDTGIAAGKVDLLAKGIKFVGTDPAGA